MDSTSLIFLLLLAGGVWFWLSSIRVLELARSAGREACIRANVQFLDDTVASIGVSLVRDAFGRRVLRRTYRFEFSETGNSRIEGRVVMQGESVESVTMDPYLVVT
ncbi:hypothetical protein OYT1_ch2220 [Ferriphaselus amnicola]|uniref:DUF3301 domain-containing protein n=1 Tax=Ferriphaselus amnicola TaxID=1188319 RepID=A0A2Z6GE80_9PROT|nr:DUF3301 domain-containing protein [Ferriphaselus amnicola]BBE51740.1 hypothetical protein OYT1_ch2220 [Ferriphaselus amnicola]